MSASALPGPVERDLAGTLDGLARDGLRRELRDVVALGCGRARVDGREVVSFASCDYLGLARHPRLARAAAQAALGHGTSAGSARLLAGHDDAQAALERELAATFGRPAALVFGSGYLANLGVITSLAGPGDLIVSDALNHASTVDACRLARADVRVFAHSDLADLERQLVEGRALERRRTLVVVEGVYSMDGDLAPLPGIVALAEAHGALVVVDDAHGFGSVGPGGAGAAAALGVEDRVAVQIGNLGKALGSYGAFALVDGTLRELLVQTARSFVFTCALPPTVVAAAREGLAVLRDEPERSARLASHARHLCAALVRAGVEVPGGAWSDVGDAGVDVPGAAVATPIVPVVLGDADRAVATSRALLERDLLVPAVRPPTVPAGSSRLRLTVSSEHDVGQLDHVAGAVAGVLAATRSGASASSA